MYPIVRFSPKLPKTQGDYTLSNPDTIRTPLFILVVLVWKQAGSHPRSLRLHRHSLLILCCRYITKEKATTHE